MQTPLLQIPIKKADPIDFQESFSKYISDAYQDDPAKYGHELAALNNLRNEALSLTFDITGRDKIYRYYGQLELLDLRFPIDEKNVKILFNWHDAFTGSEIAQYSAAYEKACTIFNIAATCSSIATSQNRQEPDRLKLAFNYYQCAAGLFLYINDNFLHAPSRDLSRESINIIKDLMLAQAQECFIEKLITFDKKKGAIIAKLAAQCAYMYSSVLTELIKPDAETKGQFEKSWSDLTRIKNKYFTALAHFHKGLVDSPKYGETVAHLIYAETLAKESLKLATNFGPSQVLRLLGSSADRASAAAALQESNRSLLAQIIERKKGAIKENDLIYHEAVPNVDALAQIDKVSAVKCLAFVDICGNGQAEIQSIIGADIFHRLVPLSVHESSSMYSEEKAKLFRSEQSKALSADQDLEVALESMHVASTLDKLKKCLRGDIAVQFTDEARSWCKTVSASANADELFGILQGTKDKVKADLDDEQHECESMRSRYQNTWSQSLSNNLTVTMRADLRARREEYEQALSTDSQLASKFISSKPIIELLRQGEEYAETAFTKSIVGDGKGYTETLIDAGGSLDNIGDQIGIDKLESLLQRLKALKKERGGFVDDLKTKVLIFHTNYKIHNDDISSLLLLNKGKDSLVFQSELLKFKEYASRIKDNITMQETLLNETSKEIEKFITGSKTYHNIEARDKKQYQLLKDWKSQFDSWREGYNGLSNGVKFYTDLSDLVENLHRASISFYNSRSEERNGLVQRLDEEQAMRGQKVLREQMSRLSVGTNGGDVRPLNTSTNGAYALRTYGILPNSSPSANLSPRLMSPHQSTQLPHYNQMSPTTYSDGPNIHAYSSSTNHPFDVYTSPPGNQPVTQTLQNSQYGTSLLGNMIRPSEMQNQIADSPSSSYSRNSSQSHAPRLPTSQPNQTAHQNYAPQSYAGPPYLPGGQSAHSQSASHYISPASAPAGAQFAQGGFSQAPYSTSYTPLPINQYHAARPTYAASEIPYSPSQAYAPPRSLNSSQHLHYAEIPFSAYAPPQNTQAPQSYQAAPQHGQHPRALGFNQAQSYGTSAHNPNQSYHGQQPYAFTNLNQPPGPNSQQAQQTQYGQQTYAPTNQPPPIPSKAPSGWRPPY